jgi:hypothetical protein
LCVERSGMNAEQTRREQCAACAYNGREHCGSRAPALRRQWFTRERAGVGLSWNGAMASGWPAPRGSSSCRWPVSGLQVELRAFPRPMTQWHVRSVRNARLLTVAGAAQVGRMQAPPVSRFTEGLANFGTISASSLAEESRHAPSQSRRSAPKCSATIFRC